jgi:hypothetical protein
MLLAASCYMLLAASCYMLLAASCYTLLAAIRYYSDYFDHCYLEEEKSMIYSFTVTFGAKYLTGMVTSLPPYETFSFIKNNILGRTFCFGTSHQLSILKINFNYLHPYDQIFTQSYSKTLKGA